MKKTAAVLAALLIVTLSLPAFADPLPVLPTPALTVLSSTHNTLTLRVTAGGTAPAAGAPAGLTLQWMVVPTGWSGTWPASGYFEAVFNGLATSSPFALAAGGTVGTVVGTFDNRPSVGYNPASGILPLQHSTAYVFRVKANGVASTYDASVWSASVYGSTTQPGTQPSGPSGGGTPGNGKGKGYYKNHLDWPGTNGPNTVFYHSGQTWAEVLKTAPKGGDTYYQLAHKYIATMLRIAGGETPSSGVSTVLAQATMWFATAGNVPGVKANTAQGKALLRWASILASWNVPGNNP